MNSKDLENNLKKSQELNNTLTVRENLKDSSKQSKIQLENNLLK